LIVFGSSGLWSPKSATRRNHSDLGAFGGNDRHSPLVDRLSLQIPGYAVVALAITGSGLAQSFGTRASGEQSNTTTVKRRFWDRPA